MWRGGKAKKVRWVAVDCLDNVETTEEEDEREEVADKFEKSEVEDKSDDREEEDVDVEERVEEKGEDILGAQPLACWCTVNDAEWKTDLKRIC